ncbi:hypothetical protein K432DRAFT_11470 [Lepidopterella palustris CBS 459.81]|uniref:Mannosylglycerate hydrolase MGH1-like glycoside hydrolase domain-containing protein n=1 Tax=Lepidopterella palustris CBS 459.81 TaxID=1314670 RepID=A0A8E2ECU0_9PEZI|nr:hypothetical protein K432DRAFT_11470 [Lepidopterella palustris CBS 459.81]
MVAPFSNGITSTTTTSYDLVPYYRSNVNAYMVAVAQIIADVAKISGNDSLAMQCNSAASNFYARIRDILWNQGLQFWIDVYRGNNLLVLGRTLIGYLSFRFGVGTNPEIVMGLEARLN